MKAGMRDPHQVGWRLGKAGRTGPDLWVPFDRTTCVIGPQGSGKTLDLLVPALLDAPGGALVTLTKPEDLFLTLEARQRDGRPVAVLDPFNLAPGAPELVWDPIAGCADAMQAERRAKAFAAGTIKGATAQSSDQAARFYAGECAKVLQAYFHAAAIAGIGLDDVLMWVSSPRQYPQAEEILRTHPAAEPLWDGLLRGALYGDERTAGNTITTVQQAMALFFQRSIRARCVPSPSRPATDLAKLITAGGTIYLLGRDDPYASASPLMTAVTEQILDTAKLHGETSPHGRLCPPFLACLDELPSTAPIPTLSTRMANERALGLSFILAAQTWRQFVVSYGEDEARTIYGLSNNLVVFGGGKDIRFYQELSDLIGSVTATETRYSSRGDRWFGTRDPSWDQRRVPILEPAELRRIAQRKALVLAETFDPIIANLHRCIDGRRGKELLAAQQRARLAARSGTDNNPAPAINRLGPPD
jgi:type IV secretion system protein VirD4